MIGGYKLVAIEPGVIEHQRCWDLIASNLGFEKGWLLANYPRPISEAANRTIANDGTLSKAPSYIEDVEHFLISIESPRYVLQKDFGKPSSSFAKSALKDIPSVDLVVTTEDDRPDSPKVVHVDELGPRTMRPPPRTPIRKTWSQIEKLLEPLIINSRSFLIIDYIYGYNLENIKGPDPISHTHKPPKRPKWESIPKICHKIHQLYGDDATIYVHSCFSPLTSKDEFCEAFQNQIPHDCKVHLASWKHTKHIHDLKDDKKHPYLRDNIINDFHARVLFTEYGGISLDRGFDTHRTKKSNWTFETSAEVNRMVSELSNPKEFILHWEQSVSGLQ